MELTCPECGRAYDIPDHTTQRLFKCMCKFTFTVEGARGGKGKKKEADGFTSKSQIVELSEDSKGSISEDDISQFASNLRKNKPASNSNSEVNEKKPGIIIPSNNFNQAIELDPERVAQKNAEREAKIKAASIEEDESTQEMPGRKSKLNDIRARQAEIKFKWWNDFVEKLLEDRRWQAGTTASVVLGITLLSLGYSYLTHVPPPPPDPFLNQLLTKKEPPPQAPPPEVEAPQDMAAPAEISVTETPTPPELEIAEAESVKKIKARAVPSKPRQNSMQRNFMQMIADGKFEDIDKIFDEQKNLGLNDRALLLELALLSKDENLRSKVSFIIQDHNLVSRNPILQRTAGLFLIGDPQTRSVGVNQLQSLQLTRPRDALVSAYLGLAYKEAKRPDLALQAWSQALTQDRSLAWLQIEKEDLARANGRLDIAKEAALGLSKISGHESDGFFRLGRLAKLMDADAEAVKYLQQSIKAKEQVSSRLYLAESFVQTKEWDKAQTSLDKITKLSPTPIENRNYFFLEGKVFCGQRKLKEARSMFDRAISLDGNYLKAVEAKADCELALGDEAKASKTFEKLLKKAPQNHLVWLKYGRALRMAEKSNPKAALAAIQRSIDLQDTDRAHLEMAYALRALNRKAEAKRHLRQAIELNPRNSEAQKLANELQ